MCFKRLGQDDTVVDVFPNALVRHKFSCKAVEENLWQFKGSALHEMVQYELVALDKKLFEPCLWMMVLFTICWKIFVLVSKVLYFLGIFAQLGPHRECLTCSSSSLPQLFMNLRNGLNK